MLQIRKLFTKNPTNIPVVQDGIVIQEVGDDKNEFVWISVGEIKNDVNGTSITNIKLGRYSSFTMTTTTTPPTPPEPKQEADKTTYDVTTTAEYISGYCIENSQGICNNKQYRSKGNFESLGTWISNTIDNGGYFSNSDKTSASSRATCQFASHYSVAFRPLLDCYPET